MPPPFDMAHFVVFLGFAIKLGMSLVGVPGCLSVARVRPTLRTQILAHLSILNWHVAWLVSSVYPSTTADHRIATGLRTLGR